MMLIKLKGEIIMGCCRDCIYFRKRNMVNHYCVLLVEKSLFGEDHYKQVSPSASCNHFTPISTAENSGYTGSSGSSCFLTSACVEYLHKADDCEELTKLRKFRDTYVKNSVGGDALIKEYYAVAPAIVEKINLSDKKDEFYQNIYDMIQVCLAYIDRNENEKALQEYKAMVLRLQTI